MKLTTSNITCKQVNELSKKQRDIQKRIISAKSIVDSVESDTLSIQDEFDSIMFILKNVDLPVQELKLMQIELVELEARSMDNVNKLKSSNEHIQKLNFELDNVRSQILSL